MNFHGVVAVYYRKVFGGLVAYVLIRFDNFGFEVSIEKCKMDKCQMQSIYNGDQRSLNIY